MSERMLERSRTFWPVNSLRQLAQRLGGYAGLSFVGTPAGKE